MALPREGTEEWYRAQYDADTLISAEEIKADASRREYANEVLKVRAAAVKKAAAQASSDPEGE